MRRDWAYFHTGFTPLYCALTLRRLRTDLKAGSTFASIFCLHKLHWVWPLRSTTYLDREDDGKVEWKKIRTDSWKGFLDLADLFSAWEIKKTPGAPLWFRLSRKGIFRHLPSISWANKFLKQITSETFFRAACQSTSSFWCKISPCKVGLFWSPNCLPAKSLPHFL